MTFNVEKVREAINDLREYEQVQLWNECCCCENYMDDYIEANDPDEFLYGETPTEILSAVDTENYNINDNWACGTIYGWVSFDYLNDKNSPFDIDEVIDWYCYNKGYEQTNLLDKEELIEENEEDADEE